MISHEKKMEWAEDIATRHLESLEYLSVGEMLQGDPLWDELTEADDPDYDLLNRLQEELHDLVLGAEVHWPNIDQRYKET